MKLLITTSTLPVSDSDEVPGFVKEQAIHLKRIDEELKIIIHAPHNYYSRTYKHIQKNDFYKEMRFHYFWPFRFELLSGRGIMPALATNKLLYGQLPFFVVCQFLSLWRLARKEKPDLLYAHWFTPQAITAMMVSKLTGIPFVFTTHASDVSVLRRVPFGKALVQHVCKRANAYSAVSDRTAQKLKRFFAENQWQSRFARKLTIVPMGVKTAQATDTRGSLEGTRRKYLLDQRPVILYLGRLVEKKGVSYLLEALALLPQSIRDSVQVVIAGDGHLRGVLEEKADHLNLRNVAFVGFVHGKEKDNILALAQFLCLPSVVDQFGDSEGFPVVLMEGLAAGKIILASDVSGGEAIFKNQESGFLFAQKSPTDLAEALVRALNLTIDEANSMMKKSRLLATQFSWNAIAKKYYQILNDAITNGT